MPDAPGTHLGKIFDYLASGVDILMAPDDHSVVGDLIRETKAGYIANTPEEVCHFLTKQYHAWSKEGTLKYKGIDEKINQYSREAQVEKMAELIKIALTPNLPA